MIRKLFIIFLLPVLSFAQEQTNTSQSIELPEFVITGVERVSLPAAVKPKAELIPVLSEDFFKPSFSPEQLHLAEISNPVKKGIDLFTKAPDYNGRIKAGVGTVSLPTGLLSYGTSYNNGTFFAKVFGLNEREYEENAGINNSGIELNNSLFIKTTSPFLPGSEFNLGGSYYRESYRFYGSVTPALKRDLHFGEIHLNTSYLLKENFKFAVNLSDKPLYIKDLDLTENSFEADMSAEGGVRNFQLVGKLKYIGQSTDEAYGKKTGYNFISPGAYIRLKDTDNYKLEFGFNFTSFNSKNIFQPHAFAGLRLSKRFSIFGEYKPQAQLLTTYDLLHQNRFFKAGSTDNFLIDEKSAFKIALRYEYETFFEVDGGFRYSDFNSFPYFEDSLSNRGKFDLKSTEARRFTGFVNLLFHLGPFGVFYGDAMLEQVKNDSKLYVPYQPSLKTNLSYGYNLPFGLKTGARLTYASSSYADSLNTFEIPGILDLSLHFSFEIVKNFDLFSDINNLFNRNNYYWRGYREKPADFIVGIDYRW